MASLRRDETELLAFFDSPADQRVIKGAGSRQKGPLMAFQLLAMAERRWRRINAPQLVLLVRAGVRFLDGVEVEPEPRRRSAA